MSIVGYGNILRGYSVFQKLGKCPGFSLEKFCNDTKLNYNEVRCFITFCEKVESGQINVKPLKKHLENYNQLADELIMIANN